jgi:hypothetical protein
MGWGVPATEMLFRMPVLLCGLAALLTLPAAFAGRVSRGTVLVYRWLIALSPVLVLYSRIARSYMPMVLCGFGAVLAFDAWWRTRSRRAGAAYVLLGALAVWLHLGAGPLVAAPFLFAVGDLALHRRDVGRNLRDLVALGLALTAAFALFLVPARESLFAVVASKRVEQWVPWKQVIPDVLKLQAGTASSWIAALFWGTALAGVGLLLRRDRRLGLYTLTVAAGHVAGILILSPLGLASPTIFGRYLLPVLPLVLLWAAAAFDPPWQGARWAAALFLAALAAVGPFADPRAARTSFLHHNDFMAFYRPRPRPPSATEVPELYRHLGGETVVELPWVIAWESNRTFYRYQEIHGGRVVVSTPQRIFVRPPLALRNAVPPEPAAFCGSGARYLIVHLNVAREEDRIPPGGQISGFVMAQPLRRALHDDAGSLARRLARTWGPPFYADREVRAWDLRAACGGRLR